MTEWLVLLLPALGLVLLLRHYRFKAGRQKRAEWREYLRDREIRQQTRN